jgi:hypothetical protein
VRATNVADVHVLAQDMVHNSDRQRLLVFCDNRQDAAFQAGWMKDHARRFRLRALMSEGLKDGALSIGDLTLALDDMLEKDESLSRALVPEVWQVVRKEGGGGRHEQERKKFLRIQVLREVTLSARQAIGLEPWGRMKVEYQGLETSLAWIQKHARELGIPAEELREGVASLLDYPWYWGFDEIKDQKYGKIRTPLQFVRTLTACVQFEKGELEKNPDYEPPEKFLEVIFRIKPLMRSL